MYLVTYRSKSLIMYSSSACTRGMFEENATHCTARDNLRLPYDRTHASLYTQCPISRCSQYYSALAPVLACQRGTSTKMYEQISAFQSAGLLVYCCVLDKTALQEDAGPRHTLNPPACHINSTDSAACRNNAPQLQPTVFQALQCWKPVSGNIAPARQKEKQMHSS